MTAMHDDHGMARMQEILSSYYGMQDKESEEESLRNIDAQGFDANTYVKELLKTKGLNDLLQRDDQLIREIKELDTNMQMLVYENYNKFISATDTIRKMKNNVATMEDEVAKVVSSMDVITDKSEVINVALAPHRSKVEKLIGVRRLLKRLEFIFELPQRLKHAIHQEEYATATRYFLLARRILGRYEHITSFKAIQVEAEKIMQQLEQLLCNKLKNESISSEEICETIGLLSQLDACTDEMKQQFLDWHQQYFEQRLRTKYVEKQHQDGQEPVALMLRRVQDDFVTPFASVLRVYKTHFLPELVAKEKAHGGMRSSMAMGDDAFANFAYDTFQLFLNVCETQFRRPHQEFGDSTDVINNETLDQDDDNEDMRGRLMMHDEKDEYLVLMIVLKQFVADIKQLDAILPPLRLVNGAIEMVETCVRFQIECVFRKRRADMIELLLHAHPQVQKTPVDERTASGSSLRPSVQPLAHELAQSFTEMMKQVLMQMEPLVQTGATILKEMSRLFSDLVQAQFYDFLKWFNAAMLQYTEPKRAFERTEAQEKDDALPWLEPTPRFLLFLAFVCRDLANDGISDCIQVLIECLPANSPATGIPANVGFSTNTSAKRQHPPSKAANVDVTHMIQVTRETSTALLLHLAKLYGNQLGVLLEESIAQLLAVNDASEPRSVQNEMDQVLEAIFRLGREVAIALGDEQSVFVSGMNSRTGSRDFRRRTSALRSRGGASGSSSMMQMDIERIFAKQIQIFPPSSAEFSTDWFVHTVLKMMIKAYGELLRECTTLTKTQLQQVQLNAEFLRSTTMHLITEMQEIESLLSDVLSNARERATNDILMEQSSVVAIVSTRSAQILTKKG